MRQERKKMQKSEEKTKIPRSQQRYVHFSSSSLSSSHHSGGQGKIWGVFGLKTTRKGGWNEIFNCIAIRKPSPLTTFLATLFGDVLFQHRPYHQVRKEKIFKFCQSTGERISITHRPREFLLRRPEPQAPAREGGWEHFLATRFHLQLRLTPFSHSPFVFVPSEPYKCIFWGFCLRRPSKQPFRRPPVTSSPPRALHVSQEVFFYPSSSATFDFLYYLVSHSRGSSVFLLSAAI